MHLQHSLAAGAASLTKAIKGRGFLSSGEESPGPQTPSLQKMKVGDSVYLITDQLQTGAGIPAMVCEIFNSTVKVAIEEPNGTKLLQVRSWDLLPANLFTRSVLSLVYEICLEIERDHGSILNLKPDTIV